MEEIVFLFIFLLLYLYSFIYKNISILSMVIVAFGALYLEVSPIFVWIVVFIISVLRFSKESVKDEF